MRFEELSRLALTHLVGAQDDDGSWYHEDIASCAAIETLIELLFGPFASWRSSEIAGIARSGHRCPWPLRFSNGCSAYRIPEGNHHLAAIWRGFGFRVAGSLRRGFRERESENPWVTIKWSRLFSFVDPDARSVDRLPEPMDLLECGAEPWLLAQLGSCLLLKDGACTRKEVSDGIFLLAERLSTACLGDHWESRTCPAEETTSIVAVFLLHPGLEWLLALRREQGTEAPTRLSELLSRKRSDIMNWILARQDQDGAWCGSPSVTTHCVNALTTGLEGIAGEGSLDPDAETSVRRALRLLLSDDIVDWWTQLVSYAQIDVLRLLLRLSFHGGFKELLSTTEIQCKRLSRDVFISHGGCDRAFALRLSEGLERKGLKVWVAEWDLAYGSVIGVSLESSIRDARAFLIVLSPESIGREWVQTEIRYATERRARGEDVSIIPVLYKACEPTGPIGEIKWIDFTDDHAFEANIETLSRTLLGRKDARRPEPRFGWF